MRAILALTRALQCYISTKDYHNCSATLVWIIKLASEANDIQLQDWQSMQDFPSRSVFTDLYFDARVSLVFVFTLQGDFQQARDFIHSLHDDTTVLANGGFILPLLTDLVSAASDRDVSSFEFIEATIRWHLNSELHSSLLTQLRLQLGHHIHLLSES